MLPVALSLAKRSLINVFRVPGAFVPILVMPIFFLIAFSGSFSGLARGGLVPTDSMVNWILPYAAMQGSAFAGMGATFSVARDIEGGFYDRLLLAPLARPALLLGPVLAAVARSSIPVTITLTVALLAGGRPTDWLLGIPALALGAATIAAMAALWGLGIVYRFRSQRAMGLVQVGIFLTMFLSAAMVPVRAISGWVQPIARYNPITNLLRLTREGFLPGGVTWHDTWGGLLASAGCIAVLAWFAWSGFRRIIP